MIQEKESSTGNWFITHNCNFAKRWKKKYSNLSIVLFTFIAIAVPLCALIWLLSFRNELNRYENQIQFFDNRYTCAASYHDTNVILANDNQNKLRVILSDYHGKLLFRKPEITDTITFSFSKENTDWVLTVSETDSKYLKIDLIGEQAYHFYIQESDYFDRLVKLSSPDGWDVPNKVIGKKKS